MYRRWIVTSLEHHLTTWRKDSIIVVMYKVIEKQSSTEFANLDLALAFAKELNVFVTIQGGEFEIVGVFGVDSVKDGLCPDGVKYDWNKASRIGRVKKER